MRRKQPLRPTREVEKPTANLPLIFALSQIDPAEMARATLRSTSESRAMPDRKLPARKTTMAAHSPCCRKVRRWTHIATIPVHGGCDLQRKAAMDLQSKAKSATPEDVQDLRQWNV